MSGLSDFRKFLQDFIALITAGVATTALVLVTALVGLAPPWPPALVQITAIGQLIALILVYQIMKSASKSQTNRKMIVSLAFGAVLLLLYLSLHSLLVFEMPNGDNGLRGFECTSNATLLYAESCPFLNRSEIADAEFNADRLWTPLGLMGSRVSMIALWIGFFTSLVFFVGLFVVYQRRR